MTILVPIRYPLTDQNRRTLDRAIELREENGSDLVVFHVDLVQHGPSVRRRDLRTAVRREFGPIEAEYRVRKGIVLEEAIVDEAAGSEADVIVIGSCHHGRLRKTLRRVFRTYVDLQSVLKEELDVDVEVVQ